MKKVLMDTGPLLALFDQNDKFHASVVSQMKVVPAIWVTTWPVITEVSYMLGVETRIQHRFLKWIEQGGVDIVSIERSDLTYMIGWMDKYQDLPMDLADASLVALALRLNVYEIFTVDRDFDIYAFPGALGTGKNGKRLKNLLKLH